jgi:hypothetical protein
MVHTFLLNCTIHFRSPEGVLQWHRFLLLHIVSATFSIFVREWKTIIIYNVQYMKILCYLKTVVHIFATFRTFLSCFLDERIEPTAVLCIRIRIWISMDPHQTEREDPDPDPDPRSKWQAGSGSASASRRCGSRALFLWTREVWT